MDVTTERDEYRLTDQATMPTDVRAHATVTGLCDATPDDLVFVWIVSIAYVPSAWDPANAPSDPIRYVWRPQRSDGSRSLSRTSARSCAVGR